MGATSSPLLIATRGSALALAQANLVLAHCRRVAPDLDFEIKVVKTTGDKLQAVSLIDAALPKGLFTKELEVALQNREADFAVHSLKDLPTELPPTLTIGAVLERADVRDVLIYRASAGETVRDPAPAPGTELNILRAGAVVATSSSRRQAQMRSWRPDLSLVPMRGNVPTRLRKIADAAGPDAIILALAGLQRLSFTVNAEGVLVQTARPNLEGHDVPAGLKAVILSLETMLPCVGQGAIGLEVRADDERARAICAQLNHYHSQQAVTAERSFLRGMGGGCQLAVAAFAQVESSLLRLRAASYLGKVPQRGEKSSSVEDAARLGETLAGQLRA